MENIPRIASASGFHDVGWRERVAGIRLLWKANMKLLYARKYWLFLLAGVGYIVVYYLLNQRRDFPLDGREAFTWVFTFPGMVLAMYVMMELISREEASNSLEGLFNLAGRRWTIWGIKIACAFGSVILGMGFWAVVSRFVFPDINPAAAMTQALAPVFVVGVFTLLMTVLMRSGYAGAMVVLMVLAVFYLLFKGEGMRYSRFNFFLNPFVHPEGLPYAAWAKTIVINRILLGVIGNLLLLSSILCLDRREKLLS